MKGLFGFLFAIFLALALGCLYLRAELRQTLKARDDLEYKLQKQERKFQQKIAQAIAHCEAEQKRICNRQIAVAERIAFQEGEVRALEKCAAKVEQVIHESTMRSETHFNQMIQRLKANQEQRLGHEIPVKKKEEISAFQPAPEAQMARHSNFLLKGKRMNWFVLFMILLSPVLASVVQRIIAGKRGFL
jgi:hypothetical protein